MFRMVRLKTYTFPFRTPEFMIFEVTESLKRSNWHQIHQCCRRHGLIHFTRAAIFVSTHTTGLRYFVYFHSATENIDRRKTLRQTWVNVDWHNGKVAFLFFVGKSKSNWEFYQDRLHEEIKAQGDIVFGDFLDVYRNTILKALFALNWISKHCRWMRFATKVHENAFLWISSNWQTSWIRWSIIACSVNRKKAMMKTASWRK